MELEILTKPSLDLNALELDDYGYPIILDYGPAKGLLYELRSSIRDPSFRSIELVHDKSDVELERAIVFQKILRTHVIESMREKFVDSSILGHFKLFSPSCYPPTKDFRKELKFFGGDELEEFIKFYGEYKTMKGRQFY